MAQLKDLIVAGSARLLGKTYFEDTVTINDTLEVDAIKADSVITPSLNSDGTALTVGGNISLTASGKYITVGDGTASTSTSDGVLRVVGGLNASKSSYFNSSVTLDTLTVKNTSAVGHINFSRGNFNYITAPASGVIAFVVNGQGVSDTTSELIIKDGEVRPGTTNVTSLGTSSYRWSNLYGVHLNITGSSTLGDDAATDTHTIKGNTTLSGNFIPGTTIAYGLGSTSKYWKNLYVGDGTAGAVSNTGTQTGSIVVNGGMSLSNDIAIKSEDNDRAIKFVYGKSSNNGYGWQIKYAGTGSDDTNYLQIDSSGTSGSYSTAVRYGLITLDAGFGGHVYPITAFGKNIGSTSNPWATVYAKSHKIYNANKSDAGGLYVQTDGTTSEQGESYVVVGNSTASGKAGNSRGSIFLYSTNTGYTRLMPGTNNTSTYTLYLPGANGQLVYHTNDTAVGSSMAPVYVDSGGKITECNMAASGDYWGALPVIGSDGVMEVGKYFDFHITDASTSDYDYRLEATATNLKGSGALEASTSIKAGTSITAGTTMTVGTNLTVKGTTTLGDAEGDTVSIVGDTTFSNDVVINKTLNVKGNTTFGDATSDTTTIQGTVTVTGNGTLATGSTATALSGMTGNIKVLNGGIVTNKDVAADNFYVKDKVRIKYDTTNDYLYFVFN